MSTRGQLFFPPNPWDSAAAESVVRQAWSLGRREYPGGSTVVVGMSEDEDEGRDVRYQLARSKGVRTHKYGRNFQKTEETRSRKEEEERDDGPPYSP